MIDPPADWSDVDGWDRHLRDEVTRTPATVDTIDGLRFAPFAVGAGGRVWFPGCGVDPSPALYAALGCRVVATDLTPFAIEWQARNASRAPAAIATDWDRFVDACKLTAKPGSLWAMVQDFTEERPDGVFDVIVNRRAFAPLARVARARAASHLAAALRPGGHVVVATLHLAAADRVAVEDSLLEAGFFLPGQEAERWLRDRVDAGDDDGAVHDEYKARRARAAAEAKRRMADGTTKIAHVVSAPD